MGSGNKGKRMKNEKCKRCQLHECPVTTVCLWGSGPTPAPLMLIGEAPGYQEDRSGLPFQGKAGQLLNRILEALGIDRTKIYITNVLKCRPHNNELPSGRGVIQECVDACWPYLEEEIQSVDPKAILLMGKTPLVTLTGLKLISRHEGTEIETIYDGAKTFTAYHPAYILRSPSKEANLARAIALAAMAAKMKINPQSITQVEPFPYEVRV